MFTIGKHILVVLYSVTLISLRWNLSRKYMSEDKSQHMLSLLFLLTNQFFHSFPPSLHSSQSLPPTSPHHPFPFLLLRRVKYFSKYKTPSMEALLLPWFSLNKISRDSGDSWVAYWWRGFAVLTKESSFDSVSHTGQLTLVPG